MNKLYFRSFALSATFIVCMLLGFSSASYAQNILVVNDNDNITYNTDTVISALDHSAYSTYHYWSIPDSAGAWPTSAYMATYDLVIWYCSTDGVGLAIWGTSTAGNSDLVAYANSGKPLWIIGLDILYQKYTTGSTFVAGEMPKDIMGLASYDVQSYADDANTGCPEVARISTASTLFPDTVKWSFPTLWYVDGCTPDAGTLSLYQMSPASYALSGRKCMFHNHGTSISVMSTFFDPALIDIFEDRINFMEQSITYLLGSTTNIKSIPGANVVKLYPNPAASAVTLEINAAQAGEVSVELFNAIGSRVGVQTAQVTPGKNIVHTPLDGLSTGIYVVKVTDAQGNALYVGKLTKQ